MEESAVLVDSFFSIIINCDTKNSSIPVENKHSFFQGKCNVSSRQS